MRRFALLVAGFMSLAVFLGAQRWSRVQIEPNVAYDGRFTFARIRYTVHGRSGWEFDYPAMERNLMTLLREITLVDAHAEESNIHTLDDPALLAYPVAYVSEPGYWIPSDAEVEGLRTYLAKGGFIIFDDFEGNHWVNLEAQMRRVVPELQWVQINVEHPIFQTFFELKVLDVPHPSVGVIPRYMALFEDNDPGGRVVALANHNGDLAEYWEWSAEGLYNPDPTSNAYRLGVNYFIYALTH